MLAHKSQLHFEITHTAHFFIVIHLSSVVAERLLLNSMYFIST